MVVQLSTVDQFSDRLEKLLNQKMITDIQTKAKNDQRFFSLG